MKRSQLIFCVVISVIACLAVALQYRGVSNTLDTAADRRTSADLQAINTAIQKYASSNFKLPSSLADIKTTLNDTKVAGRLSKYQLKDVDRVAYSLCATFRSEVTKPGLDIYPLSGGATTSDASSSSLSAIYSGAYDFAVHPKGEKCYKLQAYGVDGMTLQSGLTAPSAYSGSTTLGNSSATADDARLAADVRAFSTALEVYYSDNGAYPPTVQGMDSAWRAKNLFGLDTSTLDRQAFGYTAMPAGCTTQCSSFTISYVQSNGTRATKQSLN